MFDWFDEPVVYYRRFVPMRSGVFDYMSRWMDSVDRAMEREFGSFYDPFFTRRAAPIDHSDNKQETKKDAKEETKKDTKEDAKEEKKEEAEPQYYSFSSSMYTGSDGVQHIYREETDSKTGQKKFIETRRIGDKSMTLQRVTNKDGTVEEHETRKNIKDDAEAEQFKKDWISRNVPQHSTLPEPKKEEQPKAVKHEEKKE